MLTSNKEHLLGWWLAPTASSERQTLWWLRWVATVKELGTGKTYIFICVHLRKVISHTAQTLPDKCPGNSIIPLWVAHLSWLRWRPEWGTDGTSSLTLALTYELQAEPDEHTWLIICWMFSRGSLKSWAAPGINEGMDRNVKKDEGSTFLSYADTSLPEPWASPFLV